MGKQEFEEIKDNQGIKNRLFPDLLKTKRLIKQKAKE